MTIPPSERDPIIPHEDDLWLLCGDGARYGVLHRAGISYQALDDVLSPEDCETIDDHARVISRHWYHDGDDDISSLFGVSLGSIIELWLRVEPILCCLKLMYALRSLADSRTIQRLVVSDDLSSMELISLAKAATAGTRLTIVYYARP